VPEGTEVTSNNLSYWVPVHWDDRSGRVTLVGDAAHPMIFRKCFKPYYPTFERTIQLERGQGVNHVIADATVLVKELTAAMVSLKSEKEAVEAYQTEMVSRAGEEVVLGVMNTETLHDWNQFSQSALMQKGEDLLEKWLWTAETWLLFLPFFGK
jgi:2-polyprenyl-6-methoxyphenol hydroxylase-like FAD-dependent oxidoreductase